ncbi:MBL fold metallo-hydrolase [Flavivirga spongiicola]|uniref:MBL fold metallo-hydrolase n=1 Tax=Flavivirga spongiicola TaxID=421621 RepID=A0ABU7XMG9_9FLAO|nr:MBL fold metallo-hydrolase [Flavivirga sp. MEBiC05379]MDO5981595.1 MBL fold metallo-hydrolase [Flavivirga sp. MEBiC05379]
MSIKLSIELFPAANGDAILIEVGQQIILIDCGYISTYKEHLKPRLQALKDEGKRISILIVTHIDADHISGAIAFLKENGSAQEPNIISIDDIWFNSYRHLHFQNKESGSHADETDFFEIPSGLESNNADDPNSLVSYSQGTSLGSLILKHGYTWNGAFMGSTAMADSPKVIQLNDGLSITVLGPTQEALDNMSNHWYKYLKTIFQGKLNEDAFFDDAFELMMEEMRQSDLEQLEQPDPSSPVAVDHDWVTANYKDLWSHPEDKSPTNGASIIFMLEYDNGTDISKKLLFPGDSIPSQLLGQLQKLVAQRADLELPVKLDVFKVPHHGANKNNNPELIANILSEYYLFSTNGSGHYSHPDMDTLAQIVKSHGTEKLKTLVFNYRQFERFTDLDNLQLKNKYKYQTIWPDVDQFGNGHDGYIKLNLEF